MNMPKKSKKAPPESAAAVTVTVTDAAASSALETAAKPAKEKRALRYRSTCPAKLYERLERAETQRLYLVERNDVSDTESRLVVLGSTGNVYTVNLCEIPTCTCPDFAKKQDLCKHIMFVTLKVVGLLKTDPLSYQRAYVLSELVHIRTLLKNRRVGGGTVLANETVRRSFAQMQRGQQDANNKDEDDEAMFAARRPLEDDSDCPICFDSLEQGQLTYCRGTCGTNFHADCIRAWKTRGSTTCPNCRQLWVEKSGGDKGGGTETEGYVNLGRLQGQSPIRDTSTYKPRWNPSGFHKRRRYNDYDRY